MVVSVDNSNLNFNSGSMGHVRSVPHNIQCHYPSHCSLMHPKSFSLCYTHQSFVKDSISGSRYHLSCHPRKYGFSQHSSDGP